MFPNNKPWLSKDLKGCLNEKKLAFLKGDTVLYREKEREFRSKLRKAKSDFKDKVEQSFCVGNAKQAWDGLNAMMGRDKSKQNVHLNEDCSQFVNDLNTHYGRFDTSDHYEDCEKVCEDIPPYVPIQLSEHEVLTCLKFIKPNKAPGPDSLKGKVLSVCATQLRSVLTRLFQLLLDKRIVPKSWKMSTIIPVPKKQGARLLNDFRPVALTSLLAKCMERVVGSRITASVAHQLDPLQFAYKARRGTEDGSLSLLNTIAKHIQQQKASVRVLFIDFTSAFNTMQIHILLKRLLDLSVNGGLIRWVRDFLSDRPQKVLMNGTWSGELVLNTGAPQGCVLSPLLFSIYTDEMKIDSVFVSLFKYADDMALVGLLQKENALCTSTYFDYVSILQGWCASSDLLINVQKTKELVFDDTKAIHESFKPVFVNGEEVEVVQCFKYLGTHIDKHLTFNTNTDATFKKAMQRMYLLRKLRSFGVSVQVLENVYISLIQSVLSFNITVWFGNLSVKNKTKLARVVSMASKVIGRPQATLTNLYTNSVRRKALSITSDTTHPMYGHFELLPSGRRFRMPLARKNVFKRSFLPSAISISKSRLYFRTFELNLSVCICKSTVMYV